MKRSAQTFILTLLTAACALAIVVGAPAASAQNTNPCMGLTGAAAGLCNAYCNAQNCPAGHPGRSCERLLENWQKQTGLPFFPCDTVCCQCDGAPMCSTALRCRSAHCSVIDHCEDGKCPEPQCCECPAGFCGETTPNNCERHGCKPEDGAICTSTGRCEECPCGAQCADGKGLCVQVPGALDCQCHVPQECGFDSNGVCGGECPEGQGCKILSDGTCRCTQPPPPTCDQRATCEGNCVEPGVIGSCRLDPNAPTPVCKCLPTAPPPCDERTPCDGACAEGGVTGTCRVDASSNICTCTPPPPPPCDSAACQGTCVENGVVGTCRTDSSGACGCAPPPPPPCEQSANCGGGCVLNGVNGTCQTQPGTVPICACVPLPLGCGDPADLTCGGACPNGEACVRPTAAGPCQCVSTTPSCGLNPLNMQCGGSCASGTCLPVPNGCACQ